MTGAAEAKVRRYTLLERALIAAIVLGAVVSMTIAMVALVRQNDIREQGRQAICIARLTADFQAAVGDALAAPPAPNPDRLEAVNRISRTASRLHAIDEAC